MQEQQNVVSGFDVSSFSVAALKVLVEQYEKKVSDLEAQVEKAADDEDYDLAEDLQKELELYQQEEAPKVEMAKN